MVSCLINNYSLIKMKINNFRADSDIDIATNRTPLLFDSPRPNEQQHESFLERFRHNQVELKNKFRQYITTQKFRYPLVNKRIRTQVYSDDSDEDQELNVRAIRRQKLRLTQQLQASMNQSKYLQKKRADNQKTFYLLKNKYDKVVNIRQQRKQEVQKIEKTIQQISLQIRKEKLKYRQGIQYSRMNLTKSRIACERQKFHLAEMTRQETEENLRQLSQEKQEEILRNKIKCELVKEKEKYTQLTVSQVKQHKKQQAEEVKMERLFRQLAEKQEIKLTSSRIKQELTHRGKKRIPNHRVLDLKIKHFRKSLGERRLSPQPKIKLKLTHKLGYSQGLQQDSTNGGFPFRQKKQSFTEQAQSQA